MMKDKTYYPYFSVNMYADMIVSTHNQDEIEECINSYEVEVRQLIASNKNLDDEQLNRLSNDENKKVSETAKMNVHVSKCEKSKEMQEYKSNIEKDIYER